MQLIYLIYLIYYNDDILNYTVKIKNPWSQFGALKVFFAGINEIMFFDIKSSEVSTQYFEFLS